MRTNYIILTAVLFFVFTNCKKEKKEPINRNCKEVEWTGSFISTDTNCILPLGSDNFWMYDDSVRIQNDSFLTFQTKNWMLNIQKFYTINNNNSYKFNQWLGQLTTRNDTVFTTEYVTNLSETECYKYRPLLMKVKEKSYLNLDKTEIIYPESGSIQTNMGIIPYNYVYENGGALKYFINHKIGIIRIEIIVDNKIKRSKTLNNYKIK
jgi:hypothetical protein